MTSPITTPQQKSPEKSHEIRPTFLLCPPHNCTPHTGTNLSQIMGFNGSHHMGFSDGYVECVRQAFLDKDFSIKSTGKFVVFRVGNLKDVILRHSHLPARVVHLPNKKDQSHCGVFGYTGNDSTDELIAMKISQIARKDHMYPGTKSSDAI